MCSSRPHFCFPTGSRLLLNTLGYCLEVRFADWLRRPYNPSRMNPANPQIVESVSKGEAIGAGPWTVANLLTVFRIALTIPFLWLANAGAFGLALAVFFLASVTDFADGYLARRLKQQSRIGQFLDPLADKLLLTCGFVILALPHARFASVPVWVAVAVVGRDLLIVAGTLTVFLLTGFKKFNPSLLGKVTTFAELATIVGFLVCHTTGRFIPLLPFFYAIVMVLVFLSGVDYFVRGVGIVRRYANAS